MTTQDEKHNSLLDRLSLTLRIGSFVALALLALGFLLFMVTGSGQSQFMPELGQLVRAISKLDSLAIISLGILILLITPPAGIAVIIVHYVKQSNWLYAALSLTIGLALILSILFSML